MPARSPSALAWATTSAGVRMAYLPSARSSSTVRGVAVGGRADVRRLPVRVGDRLVQQMVADLGPGLVGVLGHEGHRRGGAGHHAHALDAERLALLVVVRLQLGHVVGGKEGKAESGRPAGRCLGRATDHERRMGLGQRPGGHPHGGSPVLEGLSGPGLEQDIDVLVHQLAALRPVLAVGRVLRRPVAHPGDEREPATARQVEHGDVLGHPQRVVQGQQQGHQTHAQARGAGQDHAGVEQGRRAPAVLGAVVLLEGDHVEAVLIGCRGHVQAGAVGARHRLGVEAGQDEVEAHQSHDHEARR